MVTSEVMFLTPLCPPDSSVPLNHMGRGKSKFNMEEEERRGCGVAERFGLETRLQHSGVCAHACEH